MLTDLFLLTTASNARQIKAIAEAVWDEAKQAGIVGMGQEGTAESGWVLLDFGDLIVHVFSEEMRQFYNLEELWQEGRIVMRMP